MQDKPDAKASARLLKKAVGRRIRYFRESKQWTQQQLAVTIGLESDRQVKKWESGDRFPRPENLVALSIIFAIEVKDLFDFPESEMN